MIRTDGPLWRLLPFIQAHAWPFWGGMALINLGRLLEAFAPLFLGIGIDMLQAGESAALPALGIVIVMALRFVAVASGRRMVRSVGAIVAYDLRQLLYKHLQLQGPRFFAKFPTGDLMARAINDLQLIRMLVGLGIRMLFVLGFSGLVALTFMFWRAPELTFWILPVTPVIAYIGWRIAYRIFDQSILVQEGFSTLSGQVQENLNGIRTIQTHGQEEREVARFEAASGHYAGDYAGLVRLNSALTSSMLAMTGVVILVIVGVGGSQVLAGTLTVGTFVSFLFYLNLMLAPVKEAGVMVTLFQRGASASQRIFEILDHPPEIGDAAEAAPLETIGGAIKVRDLTYHHRGDGEGLPALNGLSMEICAGEMVAILGRIGSGKSTLLRSLVRLVDPPPGTVFVDGLDIRMLPLEQVRSEMALVPQDPFLFADELGENIAYDNPARGIDEVWRAAEAADLSKTIDGFSDGLQTLVGERGVTLSGGQKQRASLARGLIRETPVLLLDDCFSSVDTETEEHILAELSKLRRGRTTLMVSHRVSTARHADRIFVLEDGRVAESGSHDELLAKGGIYAELERAQSRRDELTRELAAEGVAAGGGS